MPAVAQHQPIDAERLEPLGVESSVASKPALRAGVHQSADVGVASDWKMQQPIEVVRTRDLQIAPPDTRVQ
jgi:hypothetical protein